MVERLKAWYLKPALLIITTLLFLSLIEIIIRLFGLAPHINFIQRDMLVLSKNSGLKYELVKGYVTEKGDTINSFGFRDIARSKNKKAGIVRIVLIGDSIAFALELDRDKGLSMQMENMLNKYSQTRYEVLNMSLPGYNLIQEIELLKSKALEFSPDIVVFVYCLNDIDRLSIESIKLRQSLTDEEEQVFRDFEKGNRMLLIHSQLYRYVKYRLISKGLINKGKVREDSLIPSRRTPQGADYFARMYALPDRQVLLKQGFEDIVGICKKRQVKPFLLIFPVLLDLKDYKYGYIHEMIKKDARNAGLKYEDILNVYKENIPYLGKDFYLMDRGMMKDPFHPTALGHKLAAYALIKALVRDSYLSADIPLDTIFKREIESSGIKK